MSPPEPLPSISTEDFRVAVAERRKLVGVDLSGVRWDEADFEEMQFADCTVHAATISGVSFNGARIERCKFTGCRLVRAEFRGCNFRMADMAGIELPGCLIIGRQFLEADLKGADFSGAQLNESMFDRTILDGAKLEDADLREGSCEGLNLLTLASFKGLKVETKAALALLNEMGIRVYPD